MTPPRHISAGVLAVLSLAWLMGPLGCRPDVSETISQFAQADRAARIRPDYSSTTIPFNIAPLNFAIEEPGELYCVKIASAKGDHIEVFSQRPTIQIPPEPWHALLNANRGQDLTFEIFAKDEEGQWTRYQSVTNRIAKEEIDGFLVYRRMYPTHLWVKGEIGIYCRDLATFDESAVLSGMSVQNACLNCHSFPKNRGDKMLLGVRSHVYGTGTLLVDGQSVTKIGTKLGYTSWHPSGQMAVYSINNLPMFFHSSRNEVRDTADLDSLLAYYREDTQKVAIEPNLARKDRLENWPAWSADGKYLYFCSAPKLWEDDKIFPPAGYEQLRYDLVRVAYDIEADRWGQVETVVSSKETGKSVAMPKCSADGRWLSFVLFDHGYFPAWQPDSDIYVIDLHAAEETGTFTAQRMDLNSPQSESWQSWSSNGRWIVFSSKRLHGPFTRLMIAYVDPSGKATKPFVLPQEDPLFYESCLQTFNTPELVCQRPPITGEALAQVFRTDPLVDVQLPITMATPKADEADKGSPWHGQGQRE